MLLSFVFYKSDWHTFILQRMVDFTSLIREDNLLHETSHQDRNMK